MEREFKDHFSTKSDAYANFRPKYPRALAEALANFCAKKTTALDCGCGSGQFSVVLADFFERVVATDASSNQIANAEPNAKITYQVAPAEEIPLPDASVDLITVAQAAHWLDLEKFYAEARRVLKPQGVLALITYQNAILPSAECNALVNNFYSKTLDAYWPPERLHVESGYKTLDFPFTEIASPRLNIEADWNFYQFYGYLSTWSAFKNFEVDGGIEEISNFKDKLVAAWGELEEPQKIIWPLSLRVGRIN